MAEEKIETLSQTHSDDLHQLVQRIEKVEEEKKALSEDLKQIYSEVKSKGYDVKIIKKIISIRRIEESDRREQEALMQTYLNALGMD